MPGMVPAEKRVGGLASQLQALRELVVWPLLHASEAAQLGLKWPRGLLLYGPPGTGKTTMVLTIAEECGAHVTMLSAGSIHCSYAGESERLLRDAFAQAEEYASSGKPALIFIDEIDTICPRRSSRRQQESRLVAQLLTLMDGNCSLSTVPNCARVVVVGATNRVNAIDPALRRPGRFDREIAINPPNADERHEILCLHAGKLPLDEQVDLHLIAEQCNGYVGADIEALCREAAICALRKSIKSGNNQGRLVQMEDWNEARLKVGPSIVRGIAAEVPKVCWEDIGGLGEVKKKLQQAIEWPLKHADAFKRFGVRPAKGVLLHGPPGCSKTTIVKAVAHSANATLISLSGAEIYSMYVGEGEALVRETFGRARLSTPSIIFFDEVDGIAFRRNDSGKDGDVTANERLLSTLLTEMDGLEHLQGVLIIGATNRPDAIDAALMRPGRFDLVLYVPPPDLEARIEVLRVHTRTMRLSDDVDLEKIAHDTEFFTGAELESLCREAAMAALREDLDANTVFHYHFMYARGRIQPSLSSLRIASYANFMKKQTLHIH